MLSSPLRRCPLRRRTYSDQPKAPKSAHSQWYSDVVPAMVPVFLLGSAVYLGLQLTQLKLSHQRAMVDAEQRIKTLQAEVAALQDDRARQQLSKTTSPSSLVNTRAAWFRW